MRTLSGMGTHMTDNMSELDDLRNRSQAGDAGALNEFFQRYRSRLRHMVQLRMDRRLQGRIDPSDVLQDAFLEAVRHLDGYLAEPRIPPYLWLRYLVGMQLKALHRHHLGVKQRDAKLEVSIFQGPIPAADSLQLASRLLGNLTTPSEAVLRSERMQRLHAALIEMDPIDREILTLRHFEHLSRAESALELGIEEAAATKRYLRALQRLKVLLEGQDRSEGI